MKTKAVVFIAVICIVALFSVGCTQTESDFLKELEENKQKVGSALETLEKTMLEELSFKATYTMTVKEYKGVTREGWAKEYVDENGNTQKYEWEERKVKHTVIYNGGNWYDLAEMDGETVETWWIDGTYYEYSTELSTLTDGIWQYNNTVAWMFYKLKNLAENDNIAAVENVKRLGKKIYSVEERIISVIDAEKEYKKGYSTSVSYYFDNITDMFNSRITFTVKKDKLSKLEYSGEFIMVYLNAKSVIDSTKELVADVSSSENAVIEFEYGAFGLPAMPQ